MSEDFGHLHILIATVAYLVWEITAKKLNGPFIFHPHEALNNMRKKGRKRWQKSSCVLLFNRTLATHCKKEMTFTRRQEEVHLVSLWI